MYETKSTYQFQNKVNVEWQHNLSDSETEKYTQKLYNFKNKNEY